MTLVALLALVALSASPQQPPAPAADQAFAVARAATPAPFRLDRERAQWLEARKSDEDADAYWSERWTADARRDQGIRALAVAPADLPRGCVEIGISGCDTTAGGYLNIRGDRLTWQLQEGFTEEDGRTAGYVLLLGDDPLHPVAWGREGVFYDAPRLLWDNDTAYVWTPGGMAGTGAFNADALYRFTPDAAAPLTAIDTLSWRDRDLPALLPDGREIWKGVGYSYDMLAAHTSLWRPDDGNCCPSGGEATLLFAIEGDRLVLKELIPDDAHRP